MSWEEEIRDALDRVRTVMLQVGDNERVVYIQPEFLGAPHKASQLPPGMAAVYCFWGLGQWLKIGKVGPNSGARYTSQHYTGSARSTLAGSLLSDPEVLEVPGFTPDRVGDWIKANT